MTGGEPRDGMRGMLLSRVYAAASALVVAAFLVLAILPGTARAQGSSDTTITADGVGPASLGLSPDELADALGSDYDIGDEVRITVDFNGRVITRDGDVQFRAAMTDAGDELTLFIVSNPEYATAEGVGPTTTIAEAEAIYGDATLSWNPDNEGREFVTFANGPEGRIAFRTPGIGGNNVGLYADGEFETNDYEDDAAIAAVWVSCIPGSDCPKDRTAAEPTPEPTPTPEPDPEPTPTPAPAPDPTPTPTPDAGAGDSELPRTGVTELIWLSVVATLFVIGGVFVLIERRFLCSAWLAPRGLPVDRD